MKIGERIKKIRTEKGMSTYTLATMTGVSQSAISKLENGKRKADNKILEKLAGALNVSVDRLTGESVSCIIENRLHELGISIEDVAQQANVPLSWLVDIDYFVPGDMEFMLEPDSESSDHPLEWDAEIGGYQSYEWITRVADVLKIPGSILRAALARQEIPIPDDIPKISAKEAFGIADTEKDVSIIGTRIKQRRLDLGITADDLADKIGKSRATVYRYENGEIKAIPVTVLKSLSEILQTTPGYLMGWSKDSCYQKPLSSAPDNLKQLKNDEQDLLNSYSKLNNEGQNEARKRVHELTMIPTYTLQETQSQSVPLLNAAHARTDKAPSPEGQKHDRDIMMDDSEWE